MSVLRKLAGETAIYGISSILTRMVNWVLLTPYFTRRVFADNPAEYGQINELYVWIALLMVLTTYRMETAFFRFGRRQEDISKAFSTASWSLLGSTAFITALLLLLLPPLAQALRYGDRPDYVLWFIFIVAADTLCALPFARLRLQGRPMYFALLKMSSIGLNIAFIFIFFELAPWAAAKDWGWVKAWYRPEDKVAYVFIANFLASALLLLYFLPLYARLWHEGFDRALWRRMLAYGLPLVPSGVAGVVNQLIGVPMIKELASPNLAHNFALAGIYAAAAKFAVMMNLFTQAYNYAAEPFFFRHSGASDDRKVYGAATQAFALVGCVAFLVIMLYMDVIQHLLGKNYREGLGIVPILLAANLMLGLYYNFSIWFKLADRTQYGSYISLAGMGITLGLNAWLIPHPQVGYYAPAWASLACYAFMAATAWHTGRRHYPIPFPIGRIGLYMLLTAVFYLAALGGERLLPNASASLSLVVKTLWLLLYIGGIGWLERKRLRAWRRK